MRAVSGSRRRDHDSLGLSCLRVRTRISAAKPVVAAGILLKPKKVLKTKTGVTKLVSNQESPSSQDLELLQIFALGETQLQEMDGFLILTS